MSKKEQAIRTDHYPNEEQKNNICYWKEDGKWYIYIPGPNVTYYGNLGNHQIEEHGDGTISVTPSILITIKRVDGTFQRHGFLKHGVWEDA